MDNKGVIMILGLLIFLVIFVGGLLFIMWLLGNLVNIGIGLLTIVLPFFLIIVGAVLVKRFLVGGRK